VTGADERRWLRSYEPGVPGEIAVPDATLPEVLDRTAARAPNGVAVRFLLGLLMHPAVREAVVAGVPDAYRGETVKAFVVLRPGQGASAEEIASFCRLHLAAFKIPRQVEFRAELPKSLVGKYLRRVLVEEERARQRGEPWPGGS
jgi:acyl-CoA synthetase (AMP-forming)/AMP-acid ligase II